MVKFRLSREVATPFVTLGVLTAENFSFKCKCVEKACPSCSPAMNKAFLALPAGAYRMKMVPAGLEFTMRIEVFGIYRDATFEACEKPSYARAGSICIGTRWTGAKMEGSERAMEVLANFLNHLIDDGYINPRGAYGDMMLEIVEDDMIRMAGDDPDESNDKGCDINWNMLDEEEDESDGEERDDR